MMNVEVWWLLLPSKVLVFLGSSSFLMPFLWEKEKVREKPLCYYYYYYYYYSPLLEEEEEEELPRR